MHLYEALLTAAMVVLAACSSAPTAAALVVDPATSREASTQSELKIAFRHWESDEEVGERFVYITSDINVSDAITIVTGQRLTLLEVRGSCGPDGDQACTLSGPGYSRIVNVEPKQRMSASGLPAEDWSATIRFVNIIFSGGNLSENRVSAYGGAIKVDMPRHNNKLVAEAYTTLVRCSRMITKDYCPPLSYRDVCNRQDCS